MTKTFNYPISIAYENLKKKYYCYRSHEISNKNIAQNTITTIRNTGQLNFSQAAIDNIYVCKVEMDDGREFLMVLVNISLNQKATEIRKFSYRRLLIYRSNDSNITGDNSHGFPKISAEDCNVILQQTLKTLRQHSLNKHLI